MKLCLIYLHITDGITFTGVMGVIFFQSLGIKLVAFAIIGMASRLLVMAI